MAAMELIVDISLLTLLAVTAIAIVVSRVLFVTVMLTGAFSLLSAGLLVTLDAVDVAFTEAAVGAGIATVLLLGTLTMTAKTERRRSKVSLPSIIVTLLTGALLVYATLDMPAFGDPNAPGLKHVVPEYITGTETEIGMPNIVTAILASYRGYDTLGETTVIFTAGIGVLLLIGRRRKRPGGTGATTRSTTGPATGEDRK